MPAQVTRPPHARGLNRMADPGGGCLVGYSLTPRLFLNPGWGAWRSPAPAPAGDGRISGLRLVPLSQPPPPRENTPLRPTQTLRDTSGVLVMPLGCGR